MKAVRPPSPADTSELNSARSLAVLSVPPGSRVLCVDRGNAETAHLLGQRGCDVTEVGVEGQSSGFVPPECAETFDAILLLDVLGYLWDPSVALAWARGLLRPGGRLIASFGNVAHGAIRLSLLRGAFPYTDSGLLDRARVRFYDQRSAEALLLDAGLRIDERLRVTRGFEETEIPTNSSTWPPDVVAGLLSDRDATTYEFVFVASHAVPGTPSVNASLAERLQHRVEELEAAGHATEAAVIRMRAEADTRTAAARALEEQASHDRQRAQELEDELTRRMEELHLRHHDLRQLQADIADREAFIAQLRAQASSDRATLDAQRVEAQHGRAEVAELSARIVEMRGQGEQSAAASLLQLTTERNNARAAQADLIARLAAEHDQRVTACAQLEQARAELSALRAYASSAGFRVVNRISLGLRRHKRLYASLRSIVRRMAPGSPAP